MIFIASYYFEDFFTLFAPVYANGISFVNRKDIVNYGSKFYTFKID